ncbi:MAG: ATP-binding protein [Flexilinea sp.]|nr:ATP-binding protein [Flexilinea sp.]
MYQFHEYFDLSLRNQPYSIPGEELEDYLRLLDMVLEAYLEFKGMGSSGKLFSRGLVVTESEMAGYFSMPPFYRERDIWDPVLAAGVEEAFRYIEERTKATKASGGQLRIEPLIKTFGLSRTELLAVLLSLGVEIDRRYERIYGFLQDDVSKGVPTVGLLYALSARMTVRDGAEEAVPLPLDERMYTYFFTKQDERDGLHTSLVLQPLMKKLLMGISEEKSISPVFRTFEEEENIPVFFDDSFEELSFILSKEGSISQNDDIKRQSENAVYLGNDDGDTVLHLLYQFCIEHQEKLFVLGFRQLLNLKPERRQAALSDLFLRLKVYNGRLAVHLTPEDIAELLVPDENGMTFSGVIENICRTAAPKFIVFFGEKEEPGELAARFVPFLRIPDATAALRTKIWAHFLKADKSIQLSENVNIPDMADCYEIPYGKVRKVIGHSIANARMKQDTVIDKRLILDSLRQMNQVDFSGLATYVNPAYTWDDITITESQKAIMQTACDRYRLRNRIGEGWGLKRKNAYGNGVSVLLYGPPGTGKTMAAQVIANELTLPLYRVDISQISSKYIGETEKNLAVIFNAAAKANVILFFDEADALFSKRTSVGDSHDKYANSETAYLLQKIEEYDGMSILSTNYYNNFDDAFVRRITYSIHLQQPDKETRFTLWTTILPKTAAVSDDIDFKFLAEKFDLSGSNIKAILFNAAYMAGADNSDIEMKHIVRAMEYEFNKLGKLVNNSDFGKYEKYLQNQG